jgi:integrase
MNKSEEFLKHKKKRRSFGHIKKHIQYAQGFFGDTNVKFINVGQIEDFELHLRDTTELGDKTIANIFSDLRSFWTWLVRREKGINPIEFPKIDYELGWRNTVSKDNQQAIIEEVYRICKDVKVCIAIEWLSRYYSIRPIEMLHIQECDFDFEMCGVRVKYNKEKKPKWVPMLEEDLELVQSFPTVLDKSLPFFRRDGKPYGRKRLYKWWKKACENLGIEDVDLYGGTRHSTVKALRHTRTPEEIKRGSMHSTNKAFDRYFQIENDEVRSIYGDTKVNGKSFQQKRSNLSKFRP